MASAADLQSLFQGVLTPVQMQLQAQQERQQSLQLMAQDNDRPWRYLLERNLNSLGDALPNSPAQQQKAKAEQNKAVLQGATRGYAEKVKAGMDPSEAQLSALGDAIDQFSAEGNYEAISALAPNYLALQTKQAETAKLRQQQATSYAAQLKTEQETRLKPLEVANTLQNGVSTRTVQAATTTKTLRDAAKQEFVEGVDTTNPTAGPVYGSVDPVTNVTTVANPDGSVRTLAKGQFRPLGPAEGGKGGGKAGGSTKPMPESTRKSISNAGAQLDLSDELVTLFQPSYGGYKVAAAGDADLALKRNIFGDNKGAAEWWAKNQAKTQEIRHGLYGASFTANEKVEWMKQAINPGMLPATIKVRLAAQQAIEERVADRIGRGRAQEYSPELVETYLGRPVDFLAQRKAGEAAAQSGAPSAVDSLLEKYK